MDAKTVAERDAIRARIAQLEHEESVAARDYPKSSFRGPRQEELAQLRRALSKGLRKAYNGRPTGGR